MAPRIKPRFVAAGVNRTPNALAFCPASATATSTASASAAASAEPPLNDARATHLAAYAAANFVAVYRVQDGDCVRTTLRFAGGDTPGARVNCVLWLDELTVAAGNASGCVAVWRRCERGRYDHAAWQRVHEWRAHTQSITALAFLADESGKRVVLASASVDASIAIEELAFGSDGPCSVRVLDTIAVAGKRTVEAVALARLPRLGTVGLAFGGTDKRVYVHLQHADGGFVQALVLFGHEDCIRSLDWSRDDATGELLLASASQDNRVRIWRLTEADLTMGDPLVPETSAVVEALAAAAPGASAAGAAGAGGVDPLDVEDADAGEAQASVELVMRSQVAHLPSRGVTLRVKLDALLIAHEDWVVSVQWHPPRADGSHPMLLLTSSMDKTMMVWSLNATEHVWSTIARFGMMGGNLLGFTGAQFSPDGAYVLGSTHQNSFHLWQRTGADALELASYESWTPQLVVSGHGDEVRDCAWSPDGKLLLTVSKDQTVRLFGQWHAHASSWHEVGRPQTHGYDLNAACFVPGHSYRLVSGADEKMPRVFDAPRLVLKSLNATCNVGVPEDVIERLPIGANVPSLGLSNKAVADGDEGSRPAAPSSLISAAFESEQAVPFAASVLVSPPLEEHLVANTLWPEIHKLYGHGHEVHAVACNPRGTLVATSSRASTRDDASIRLWRTDSWQQVAEIFCHGLTVVQLAFSPDSQLLLSVSRDRTWAVHEIVEAVPATTGDASVRVHCVHVETAHSRIVWAAAWSPCGRYFATGSRDKTALVWRVERATAPATEPAKAATSIVLDSRLPTKQHNSAVTALAFAPPLIGAADGDLAAQTLLAVGFESGNVVLYAAAQASSGSPLDWSESASSSVPDFCAHTDAVLRLAWRCDSATRQLELATCSADHSVRIYSIENDE